MVSQVRRISELVGRICPGVGPKCKGIVEIREKWGDLVGEKLSEHTAPKKVRRDTLLVDVEGSAWAAELTVIGPVVLRGVNDILGGEGINRIRVSSRGIERGAPAKSLEGEEDEGEGKESTGFEEELEAIGDEVIRESLRGLMAEKRRWQQRKRK